ncbi:DNA-directed RNA polymerase subunit epsilon [Lentilactobacillus raoultii]|uniref:DNA-directed RNA polymerase subunit epsilon n=1 Tax=Lentilactobacillus raoultii TaxID=1987503 RepID=A0ABW3PKI9_9LACO|nr:DNA-directed RNA polymerase subunit epsilon [Lentilactobacillus raoultii]
MIFKVLYQPDQKQTPRRETTRTLYLEADTEVEARGLVEDNTNYAIEFVEPLQGDHLKYEQNNSNFKLTEFNNK